MNTPVKAPSITVAYVVKGFFEAARAIDSSGASREALNRYAGELNTVDRLCDLADLVERAWLAIPADTLWSGVWEYEVSEVFGAALFEYAHTHQELPNNENAAGLIKNIVASAMTDKPGARG